jgi:hypothetical protein
MRSKRTRIGAAIVVVLVLGGALVAAFDQPGGTTRTVTPALSSKHSVSEQARVSETPTTATAFGGARPAAPNANDTTGSGAVAVDQPQTTIPNLPPLPAPVGTRVECREDLCHRRGEQSRTRLHP